jgi:hypothetical protein
MGSLIENPAMCVVTSGHSVIYLRRLLKGTSEWIQHAHFQVNRIRLTKKHKIGRYLMCHALIAYDGVVNESGRLKKPRQHK